MDVIFTLADIGSAARQCLSTIGDRKVIAFHGEMGAGKTTFIHAICDELHVKDAVSSPTFSIINEYTASSGVPILHMDLYRIKDEREAMDAGVEDGLYSGKLVLVEWPEKAAALLPANTVHCYLETTSNNARKLRINL
jgi:tRNA threonylcarbamoyladenosine biosynthesis protein TsaE